MIPPSGKNINEDTQVMPHIYMHNKGQRRVDAFRSLDHSRRFRFTRISRFIFVGKIYIKKSNCLYNFDLRFNGCLEHLKIGEHYSHISSTP